MERKSAIFRPQTVEFEIHELFVARKVGFIERKCLSLLPNKHNISLFLPQCGVHIAQNRGLSPMSRRKRSLTSTYSQLYSTRHLDRWTQIEALFRGRRFAPCLSPLDKCIVVHRDRNNLCMRAFSDVKFCPSANNQRTVGCSTLPIRDDRRESDAQVYAAISCSGKNGLSPPADPHWRKQSPGGYRHAFVLRVQGSEGVLRGMASTAFEESRPKSRAAPKGKTPAVCTAENRRDAALRNAPCGRPFR